MHPPEPLLALFPPSPDLLLDRIRRQTDDAMLLAIARADYGQGADEMLTLLRAVRDVNRFPSTIPFLFAEVLALTRNTPPQNRSQAQAEVNPDDQAAYQTCLFACALLLKLADEPAFRYEDIALEVTLVHALTSAHVLGDEMNEALGQYLTWRFESGHTHCQQTVHAFSLLALATRMRSHPAAERAVPDTAKWVLHLDAIAQDAMEYELTDMSRADFGFHFSDSWGSVATELHTAAEGAPSSELREDLQLCALLGDSPW